MPTPICYAEWQLTFCCMLGHRLLKLTWGQKVLSASNDHTDWWPPFGKEVSKGLSQRFGLGFSKISREVSSWQADFVLSLPWSSNGIQQHWLLYRTWFSHHALLMRGIHPKFVDSLFRSSFRGIIGFHNGSSWWWIVARAEKGHLIDGHSTWQWGLTHTQSHSHTLSLTYTLTHEHQLTLLTFLHSPSLTMIIADVTFFQITF